MRLRTPDEGRHIREKWPCAYYTATQNPETQGGYNSPGGKGKGGKGKDGKGGKGKIKGKQQHANFSEEQIAAAVTALKSAGTLAENPQTPAKSPTPSAPSVAGSDTQSVCVASYENTSELEALLNTSTLGNDLVAFFQSPQKVHPSTAELPPPMVPSPLGVPPAELQRSKFDFSVPDFVPSRAIGLKSGPKLNSFREAQREAFREAARSLLLSSQSDPLGLHRSVSGCCQSSLSSISAATAEQTEMCVVADTSHSRFNMIGSTQCSTECTIPCSTFDGSRTDAVPTSRGSSCNDRHSAFLTGNTTGAISVNQIQDQIQTNTLPIFRAPIDSGCTATCTDDLSRLVNVRPCDKDFKAANGEKCKCSAIGGTCRC